MIDQLFQFLTRNLILPNGWYLDESDHNFTITLLATTNNVIHAPNRNNLTLIVLLLKALFLHRDFFTLTKTFIITIIFSCLYNSFLPFPRLRFASNAISYMRVYRKFWKASHFGGSPNSYSIWSI